MVTGTLCREYGLAQGLKKSCATSMGTGTLCREYGKRRSEKSRAVSMVSVCCEYGASMNERGYRKLSYGVLHKFLYIVNIDRVANLIMYIHALISQAYESELYL